MKKDNTPELIITIDIDWASEIAIEKTLTFFLEKNIPVTVFSTHNSNFLRNNINNIDIGLHPFFNSLSSHGSDIKTVVENILKVPHNIKAFRCHRYEFSNEVFSAMKDENFNISSNVCTDMEVVTPFFNRFQMLEIPIFLEDGGYLYNNHPLKFTETLLTKLNQPQAKVITIHPMHFILNTPNWDYMVKIKKSLTPIQWNNLDKKDLNSLYNCSFGIADLFKEIISSFTRYTSFSEINNYLGENKKHEQLTMAKKHRGFGGKLEVQNFE